MRRNYSRSLILISTIFFCNQLNFIYNNLHNWYVIGTKNDFSYIPKQVILKDMKYIVWKNNNKYYSIKDCCTHQGSSFLNGETHRNTIMCPYHGYIFDGNNGTLLNIPGYNHRPYIKNSQIKSFLVKEHNDYIYLNTNQSTLDENLWNEPS
jgi:phenylpropionate dioxygenase-like ring-hydroxylating dioxygenase large terminal subunit